MEPRTIVDAHVHLLEPRRVSYPWLARRPDLDARFDLARLDEQGAGARAESFVIVEADAHGADAERELEWIEVAAARDPRIGACVARAELERGDDVAPWLDRLAARPLVRGVRRVLQDDPDPEPCLRAGFVRGLRLAAERGLLFEACVRSEQLPALAAVARHVPESTLVLDHLGDPPRERAPFGAWRAGLLALGACPNVWAKVSGLGARGPVELRAIFDVALLAFGTRRLLFGSDWPWSRGAREYGAWIASVEALLAPLGPPAVRAVFAENARRLYRLEAAATPS